MSHQEFEKQINMIPGLRELIKEFHPNQDSATTLFLMEFALHGLAEFSLISKHSLTAGLQFKDLLSSMFTLPKPDDDDDDDDEIMGRRKF
jgi:magnesium chelatase subunit I